MSTHNLYFGGNIRKYIYLYTPFILWYFPLMQGIRSGPSLSAYLVFTYATKIPYLTNHSLSIHSQFTWNVKPYFLLEDNFHAS